jgi:hypothetical protein
MTTSSRAGWVRLLPLVGLVVLLLHRAYAPPAAREDERVRERLDLVDAWIITLGTLMGVMMIVVFAAFIGPA